MWSAAPLDRHEVDPCRAAAHRIDIRERVGCRDLAEGKGVIDHRREEIDGLDERSILVDAQHARVVARRVIDEDGGIVAAFQSAQNLGELGGTELRRSAGAGHALRQSKHAGAVVFVLVHDIKEYIYAQLCRPGRRLASRPYDARVLGLGLGTTFGPAAGGASPVSHLPWRNAPSSTTSFGASRLPRTRAPARISIRS